MASEAFLSSKQLPTKKTLNTYQAIVSHDTKNPRDPGSLSENGNGSYILC